MTPSTHSLPQNEPFAGHLLVTFSSEEVYRCANQPTTRHRAQHGLLISRGTLSPWLQHMENLLPQATIFDLLKPLLLPQGLQHHIQSTYFNSNEDGRHEGEFFEIQLNHVSNPNQLISTEEFPPTKQVFMATVEVRTMKKTLLNLEQAELFNQQSFSLLKNHLEKTLKCSLFVLDTDLIHKTDQMSLQEMGDFCESLHLAHELKADIKPSAVSQQKITL